MNIFTTISAIKKNGGLLILAVLFGLVLGFGLRNCSSPSSTPHITEKDSIRWNIVDSTYINWIADDRQIKNPVPSTVVANPNKKTVASGDCECDCVSNSIRTYIDRFPVGDMGFVFYNIKAIGKVTEMNFSSKIGVQQRMKLVEMGRYKTNTRTIDNTPFLRVYAGTEFNPMQLQKPSVYADVNFKKWQIGYKYQIGVLNPHHVKLGFKIFDL